MPLFRAVNSAVECHLHTVEATGSIPVPPTRFKKAAHAAAFFFRVRASLLRVEAKMLDTNPARY